MTIQISGQITVPTAGRAVNGPVVPHGITVIITAHPDNTGVMWIGNDGTGNVSPTTGYPLRPGESISLTPVSTEDLNRLILVDASVSGEKICWYKSI